MNMTDDEQQMMTEKQMMNARAMMKDK